MKNLATEIHSKKNIKFLKVLKKKYQAVEAQHAEKSTKK